ncbi:lipoyl domain-containing protein [Hoeflea sp.]|uniref:lipoyl domain-containing protein n=1 Tax=Hoeflea sp. TaxID=1940281 RepID=UPI003B01BFDC
MTDLKDIKLPELGEGVTQATLVEWLVETGAVFAADDVIAEIMTDKVSMEVIAEEPGTLVSTLVADDEEVAAGAVLGHYRPAG